MGPAKLTYGRSAFDRPAFATTIAALVNRLPNTPAIIVNGIGDILEVNDMARELFSEFTIRDNLVRMTFLDPAAVQCADAWRDQARDAIGRLRQAYQQAPTNGATSRLVSELLRLSRSFRMMWTQRDWTARNRSMRVFRHRDVGALVVDEVILGSAAEPGNALLIYVPTPGSFSDDSLLILASLRASKERCPR
ncbi:MmyB family transcriptional regulator [Mycobacterium sp. NPDC003323]